MKKFAALWLLLFFPGGALLSAQPRRLDTTTFVAVGGSLSAGYADFQLVASSQQNSFPALMAGQMRTIMPLPLFQEAAPGFFVAFNPAPQVIPKVNQSVLRVLPFPVFTFNLSVPFATVAEALNRQPVSPFVHEGDLKQTLANLILGYPHLILDNPPRWTQVEYAESMAPTLVVVELGFGDLIGAALTDDASQVTPAAAFSQSYSTLLSRLANTHASLLVLNVPDPTSTAYFLTLSQVSDLYQISVGSLQSQFGLRTNDLVTLSGLVEIGNFLRQRQGPTLSTGSVLRAETVTTIRQTVQSYNQAISTAASQNNAVLFDLNDFYQQVRTNGVQAGAFRLGGDYLQGFFSGDGLFPTAAGQAVLANRLLDLVNTTFGTRFEHVNAESIARQERQAGQDIAPSGLPSPIEVLPTYRMRGIAR